MPFRLEAFEKPLQKIFSSDFDFSVPFYQRPYAWTTEQGQELLSDLVTNMNSDSASVDETNPYFLGSIVLVKEERPLSQVVDGQQRLTTLTILLSALRPLLLPDEAEGLTGLLYEKANPILGTQNRYRLTLREQDAEFFRTYIQMPDGIGKLNGLKAAALTDSQRNLRDNGLLYSQSLTKLSAQQRCRLAQFVARRCYLVVVTTPDLTSAYKIFTVLNSRGLDLTASDILKAQLIGAIPSANQKAYTTKWEYLEDDLGRDNFQELFAHIRMIYRKAKLAETVLEEYEKHILPTCVAQAFIDDVLLPFGNAYRAIKTASYESTKRAGDINQVLKWLNLIDNVDWIPPAIAYFSKNANDPDELERFFLDLERLAAGQMILRNDINERINRYARLLSAIEQKEDLYCEQSPLQLTQGERQDILRKLDGDLYIEKKTRLFVLLRLDSELSKGQATYKYPIITVEHVLPQTPEPNSIWMQWFPTKELRETCTHRISNLVLLARAKNSQAQNYEFEVKKQKYFSASKGVVNFALTTQVLSEKEWTPAVVERRQKELLAVLKQAWRL